ncbi:unnamed protein product [Heligmosomoides polygyrus]|uniref:Uncharacterized protein n=1 Tax=Heligmosomoides polygyrus TaxID=6339 RepID=A0A183GFL1_HELPZ|nr:unnamed protein product [Heligmosomoides polygyrus]
MDFHFLRRQGFRDRSGHQVFTKPLQMKSLAKDNELPYHFWSCTRNASHFWNSAVHFFRFLRGSNTHRDALAGEYSCCVQDSLGKACYTQQLMLRGNLVTSTHYSILVTRLFGFSPKILGSAHIILFYYIVT